MADILAALVSFASKVKDDPGATDLIREAAAGLHEEVSKLISGSVEAAPPVQGAAPEAPAEPAAQA